MGFQAWRGWSVCVLASVGLAGCGLTNPRDAKGPPQPISPVAKQTQLPPPSQAGPGGFRDPNGFPIQTGGLNGASPIPANPGLNQPLRPQPLGAQPGANLSGFTPVGGQPGIPTPPPLSHDPFQQNVGGLVPPPNPGAPQFNGFNPAAPPIPPPPTPGFATGRPTAPEVPNGLNNPPAEFRP